VSHIPQNCKMILYRLCADKEADTGEDDQQPRGKRKRPDTQLSSQKAKLRARLEALEQKLNDNEGDDSTEEGGNGDASDSAASAEDVEAVDFPGFRVGQWVSLVDGATTEWGRAKILDPEPEGPKNAVKEWNPAHWPMVDSKSLKIISNWEPEPLFVYNKKTAPGEVGVLRFDGSVFKKTMTPAMLKAEPNFLMYVQSLKECKPPVVKRPKTAASKGGRRGNPK
jgi:hypothetical protein